jgi:hypothetical protein
MSEYKIPIDIMPSVRPSSGNLDKSHYLRRLILDNPNITAEEASAAFAFYDETVSRCLYNVVRAQVYGPKFTKRKTRKKKVAKVAAKPAAIKPTPVELNPSGPVVSPVLLGSARVVIGWLMQLVAAEDTTRLSGISSELNALVSCLVDQQPIWQKPSPG